MKVRVVALVAAAVVLVMAATAAVAVVLARDDARDGPFGHRDMMSAPWGDRGDEYGYLAEMVVHHEEAVAAAGELERSDRPEMREFGEAVVTTQTAQVEQMQQWLADWYPDRSGEADYRPMMRDLSGLSGERLDQAFLHDMIGHHMAAVMMSQQLLVHGLDEHPEVAALARSIRDEQHEEILRMRQWLQGWFGVDVPGSGWRAHGMIRWQ
jgi:uncharacterized protein (DUF305 family)